MHAPNPVTALTWGKKPNAAAKGLAAIKKANRRTRLAKRLMTTNAKARELEGYCTELLKFRAFCDAHNLPFKCGVVRALKFLTKCAD